MAFESSKSRVNTNTRTSQSKVERANALAELAKRRNSIAARKQSVDKESSRALVMYNPEKAKQSVDKKPTRALVMYNPDKAKQSVDKKPSRALVLYNPDEARMSSTSNNFPTFDEIKKITIRRSTLMKWYSEPFFEDLISGCFVRLSIGKTRSRVPVYRLCMVRNTDDTKSDCYYRFGNSETCKYLNLVWGNDNSTARWKMTSVGDSPPLEAEFGHLVKEANRFGGYVPTRNEVFDKIEAIRALNSSIVVVNSRPRPISRNIVMARDDMAVRNEKAVKMAELNRKNKIENFKNASLSFKRKSADNSDQHDPFSRTWTRSRNYFAIKSSGGETSTRNGACKAVASEKVVGSGVLADTDAPVDRGNELNKLHDFEMSISLAGLERFGGARGVRAGYMAEKGRIEAAYGCKVAVDDDPAKHPYAMSVDEYRKRRGLD